MLLQCDTWRELVSAAVFLASLSTLFWASSRYHRTKWKNRADEEAGALVDYASISSMVASSLATVQMHIHPFWGPVLLGVSNGLALLSIATLNFTQVSKSSRMALFFVQGMVSAAPLAAMSLTRFEVLAILFMTCAYIVGSAIYAFEGPNLASEHWTYVETWHLLVTIAAAFSFLANLSVIRRFPLI